jgi:hypothetical protein
MSADIQAQRDALAKVVRVVWHAAREARDLSGGDIEDLMFGAGLLEARPATAKEAEMYDCAPGEPVMHLSALGRLALAVGP